MAQQRSPDPERIDALHSLLADRYRRDALRYFRDASSDVASLSDVAETISDPGETEQARLELHHTALPWLDDADVVDYDARSKTVRYREHPDLELLIQSIAYL